MKNDMKRFSLYLPGAILVMLGILVVFFPMLLVGLFSAGLDSVLSEADSALTSLAGGASPEGAGGVADDSAPIMIPAKRTIIPTPAIPIPAFCLTSECFMISIIPVIRLMSEQATLSI